MTDYRVVHMCIAVDDDRAATSQRIERECDHAAREGWYLYTTISDVRDGTTNGIWLVFAAQDDHADAPAVAIATEILSHPEAQ